MSLEDRLVADLRTAMKNRDELSTRVLRMLKSQLMLEKTREGGSRELSDEVVTGIVAGYAKKLADAVEQFGKGGRQDLVESHQAELGIVRRYLPEQAGEEEIKQVIEEVVAASGASSPAEMGKVMGPVMARLKGRCEGSLVSRLVRERLQQG
ncbi:MAG: GatB/YqeY domain-containing protein [Candidatus Glassbacteria bacterium]|nr:GatB/YqeY domain-containing protein [Candidatus Glassbacteria bacterium]